MDQAIRPVEISCALSPQVSIGDQEVSIYLQRKLEHLCVRCGEDALPDADYCAAHLVAKRQSDRQWRKAARAAARRRKKCIDCGKRSRTYRCAACRTRGVDRKAASVDKQEIWREDPGTTWLRYRGKARRGRLTKEQQRAEDVREVRWAIRELEKFIENVGELGVSDELPRIQREAKRREAATPLGTARRIIEALEDRHG